MTDITPDAPATGRAGRDEPTEVIAAAGVPEFVAARGGRLYVWARTHACCTGPLTLLETAVVPPAGRSFAPVPLAADGFEVYLDAGRRTAPRTLTLQLGWRGRSVRAFWDGCAYVD